MPVTKVKKENEGFVKLAASEHVHYFVTAGGAEASFSMSCVHQKDIVRADTFPGHPKKDYDWTVRHEDLHADEDDYAVALGYLVALQYTLRIEHHGQNHNVIKVISDKDYAGKTNDFDVENVTIIRG